MSYLNVGTEDDPAYFPFQNKATIKVLREVPENLAEMVGQPLLRAYGALGGFLANKLGLASRKEFVPETSFQKELLGTDQPISFRSVGEEFPGLKGSRFAPAVGVVASIADLIPGGNAVRTAALRIAKIKDIKEIAIILRNLGVEEKQIADTASRLANISDPIKAEEIIAKTFPKPIPPAQERGFAQTVREAPITKPEVAANLESFYDPLKNVKLLRQADEVLAKGYDEALKLVRTTRTALSNAVGQKLIISLQNEGRFEEAINLVEQLAKRGTTQGQAIQSLSLYSRLTPAGILRFAQRTINEANAVRPELDLTLTPKVADELVAQAEVVQRLPDGSRERVVETARLLQRIKDIIPPTVAQKISFVQTLSQLLNPKTFIRNLGGNVGFAVVENMADLIGVPLDSALSLITGERSVTLPSLSVQTRGFARGMKEGIEDAINRVETNYLPTQYEIPRTGIFKGAVGRSLERLLNFELRVPDRAFYKAAFDGALYQMLKLTKLHTPTDAMLERAHYEALYRTFQDDSLLSQIFVRIKKALNVGKDFGVGDIVLKYPRTPGNLLARGIEYSPGGLINVIYEATKPLIGRPFNQRQFVQSFSRAILGTSALTGAGAFLHHIGVISATPDEDKDVRAIQRTVGLGQYRVNASALKRLVMSGFDTNQATLQKEDTLVSYDWFQPFAIPLTIGANMDDGLSDPNATSMVESIFSSLAEGIETLAEQPLVRGLKTVTRPEELTGMAQEILKSVPSSFVPTILSQINQLIDNTQRNSYSPEVMQYALNLAKNKIPGLAQTLPPSISVFGEELERYQGKSNNIFNVFFNPAFVTHYQPTKEAQMVFDLIRETGDTTHVPRVVSYSATINGEKKKLTPTQITAMQRYVGTITRELFHRAAQHQPFQSLPAEDKIKYLSQLLTDIGSAGKILILGNRPKKVNRRVQEILNQ